MGHPLGASEPVPQNELELYPEEKTELVLIWSALNDKYQQFKATPENMQALVNEAVDRIARIGLRVHVDTSNIELDSNGEAMFSPIIIPYERFKVEETHDFERHSRQVQLGLDDGLAGVIKGDGSFSEPSKFL